YLEKAGVYPRETHHVAVGDFQIPVNRMTVKSEIRPGRAKLGPGGLPAKSSASELAKVIQQRQTEYERLLSERVFLSPSLKMREAEKYYVREEEDRERVSDPR